MRGSLRSPSCRSRWRVPSSARRAPRPVAPSGAPTPRAEVRPACSTPGPREASCFALVRIPVAADSSRAAATVPYVPDSGAASAGPAGGLTPQELATVYGYDPGSGGAGQTVGIVDAFDDPRIESDLATFDARYGLPACTATNECLRKVGQTGSPASLPARRHDRLVDRDLARRGDRARRLPEMQDPARRGRQPPPRESLAAGVDEAVPSARPSCQTATAPRRAGFQVRRIDSLQPSGRADPRGYR